MNQWMAVVEDGGHGIDDGSVEAKRAHGGGSIPAYRGFCCEGCV